MLAAEQGHVRVVEELVKAGAKLDLQNNVCLNTSSTHFQLMQCMCVRFHLGTLKHVFTIISHLTYV